MTPPQDEAGPPAAFPTSDVATGPTAAAAGAAQTPTAVAAQTPAVGVAAQTPAVGVAAQTPTVGVAAQTPTVRTVADAPGLGVPGVGTSPGTGVHPRLWQRRVAVLRDRGRRRLRWVVGGVAVLVALCLALLVLHTPLLAVRHTTVLGVVHTPEAAVLAAAGLTGHPPLVDVDPGAAARRIEQLPWVARAVVARHWPDAVTVTVTERVPLGTVARPGGGAADVDAAGHVLAWTAGAPAGLVLVVPVAAGLPGSVLAAAARPALVVGAALPGALAVRVRRVVVAPGGSVTLDLGGGVTAVLGGTDGLRAKLGALVSVLAAAAPRGPAVIDVTVPDQPTVGVPTTAVPHP